MTQSGSGDNNDNESKKVKADSKPSASSGGDHHLPTRPEVIEEKTGSIVREAQSGSDERLFDALRAAKEKTKAGRVDLNEVIDDEPPLLDEGIFTSKKLIFSLIVLFGVAITGWAIFGSRQPVSPSKVTEQEGDGIVERVKTISNPTFSNSTTKPKKKELTIEERRLLLEEKRLEEEKRQAIAREKLREKELEAEREEDERLRREEENERKRQEEEDRKLRDYEEEPAEEQKEPPSDSVPGDEESQSEGEEGYY